MISTIDTALDTKEKNIFFYQIEPFVCVKYKTCILKPSNFFRKVFKVISWILQKTNRVNLLPVDLDIENNPRQVLNFCKS